ncbi:hypothetical protein [Candidatus Tisiphia endosymbiont of Ptychoptera albimana]|jgi:hypothetical protein|uniref:hypothetical protein n=1 Tax=Candidatus Tisiphia endosymbiont of Ptychoptera albimana TaxID=3066260 RepID=UPI001DE8EFB7|nr:hypothetical protein [Rickettsia endosymbiont of Sericostoma sp. HW-2014]
MFENIFCLIVLVKLTYLGEDSISLISLPNEVLNKIFSYLKLSNVEHSVPCADDQTTPLLGEEPTE